MSSKERMNEARDVVTERNLMDHVFALAKVDDKVLTFDELMARSLQKAE
jgi:hypothetical protein